MSIDNLIESFLSRYKNNSLRVYRSDIKQFFKFYTGDINNINESDIINYRKSIRSSMSDSSLIRKISILNKFFNYIETKSKGFKNPISNKYGDQTKYQTNYLKSNRKVKDFNLWLQSLPVRENTKETYRINVNKFLEWFGGAPRELSKERINEYKNYMKEFYKTSTIWLKFIALNSFIKYELGLQKASELLSFKELMLTPPKKDKGYYQVLQKNELSRLLAQPDTSTLIGKRDSAILWLMCTYGLRANEVCKIRYGDFESFRVKEQQKLWIYDRKGKAGNRANTAIILNGKVLNAVDNWINAVKIQPEKTTPIFNQFIWNKSKRGLVLDYKKIRSKKSLSVRTIQNVVTKYVRRSGIELNFKISPHALRHSALTLLANEGVKLIDLKYLAGHQNISTTMIYIHSVQLYDNHVGLYHPLNKIESNEVEKVK